MPPAMVRPHDAHANRNENQHPHSVCDQPAFALTEERAKREQAAAGEDEERSLDGVNGSDQHGDPTDNDENV